MFGFKPTSLLFVFFVLQFPIQCRLQGHLNILQHSVLSILYVCVFYYISLYNIFSDCSRDQKIHPYLFMTFFNFYCPQVEAPFSGHFTASSRMQKLYHHIGPFISPRFILSLSYVLHLHTLYQMMLCFWFSTIKPLSICIIYIYMYVSTSIF